MNTRENITIYIYIQESVYLTLNLEVKIYICIGGIPPFLLLKKVNERSKDSKKDIYIRIYRNRKQC